MHPDDAEQLVESAKEEAVYHLRLALSRVRTPTAGECAPIAPPAVLEGTVTEVYRSPSTDRAIMVGQSLTCRVDACIPSGHPELRSTSPCIEAELLENAALVEIFLDDRLTCHHAAIEIVRERGSR